MNGQGVHKCTCFFEVGSSYTWKEGCTCFRRECSVLMQACYNLIWHQVEWVHIHAFWGDICCINDQRLHTQSMCFYTQRSPDLLLTQGRMGLNFSLVLSLHVCKRRKSIASIQKANVCTRRQKKLPTAFCDTRLLTGDDNLFCPSVFASLIQLEIHAHYAVLASTMCFWGRWDCSKGHNAVFFIRSWWM